MPRASQFPTCDSARGTISLISTAMCRTHRLRTAVLSLLLVALGTIVVGCNGTFRAGTRAVWLGNDDVSVEGVIVLGYGSSVDDERVVEYLVDLGVGYRLDEETGQLNDLFGIDYVDYETTDYDEEGPGYRVGIRFGAVLEDITQKGAPDQEEPPAGEMMGEETEETAYESPSRLVFWMPAAFLWSFSGHTSGSGGKYGFDLGPDKTFQSVAFEVTPIWAVDLKRDRASVGAAFAVLYEVDFIDD